MSKSKFRSTFNRIPAKMEQITNPSQTIPDQAMTVAEIMRRHANGLSINESRVPLYYGEEDDMPDLSRMDKADREMKIQEMRQQHDELRERLTAQVSEPTEVTEAEMVEAPGEPDTVEPNSKRHSKATKAHKTQYPINTPPEGPRSE